MRSGSTRHRVALLVALLGVALSVITLGVHNRLASDPGYTSFCDLGGIVDCDAVLGSRYSAVLGIPVAGLALAAFGLGVLLALPGAFGSSLAAIADLLLVPLVAASLGFSAVLAVIMASIGKLCLLCLTTDALVLAWFITVVPLAAAAKDDPRAAWWRQRRAAQAFVAAALLVAVAGGTWAALSEPPSARTVAEVQARDPKFYNWYTKLPVRSTEALITGDCHREGEPGAPVSIVEFSDFQCPFCVQAYRDLRRLIRSRSDVSLVFRHFPLDNTCNPNVQRSLHPNACLAACAAECASQQGRFWEYHDRLFENNERLERDGLFRYAREVQLDIAAFRTCLDDPATRARVGEDIESGSKLGVTSTPTLFINGRMVEGALERLYYDYALIIEQHNRHGHRVEGAS
jgi:protein-disulfide isomerase